MNDRGPRLTRPLGARTRLPAPAPHASTRAPSEQALTAQCGQQAEWQGGKPGQAGRRGPSKASGTRRTKKTNYPLACAGLAARDTTQPRAPGKTDACHSNRVREGRLYYSRATGCRASVCYPGCEDGLR